jgi:hypothetical protein
MPDLSFPPARLFAQGERLPAIKSWLLDTVWTGDRYRRTEPEQYLRTGEEAVCRLEELVATGAQQVWDELHAASLRAPTVKAWLGLDAPLPPPPSSVHHPPSDSSPINPSIHQSTNPPVRAAIIFDGLSLRELPLLLQMAEATGLRVKSTQAVATCLPTETMHFVEERVIGTRIGPSQLPGRRELAEKNAEAFYLDQPNTREHFPEDRNLLIWSTYPDRLFFNDEARTEALFTTFHRDYIPTIWKCTAQAIPRGVPIVVTSDHGYIFFGASLEATRSSDAPEILGQARMKEFAPDESVPTSHPDLQICPQTRLAMLRGRLRARPQGTSSRKLYQHGGFSLMEVLVPWIELEPR